MDMQNTLLIATRKGLFVYNKTTNHWQCSQTAFLGDPVSMALVDPRNGDWFAALNLGHFGVKLHRSQDAGVSWQEISTPTYPSQPETAAGPDWTLQQIWALSAGGADQPGRIWCGTIPGGLFCSDDHGAHWSLVRGLWDRDERLAWAGGGYDQPGIHSICVDPTDSRTITIAVSCGGVWQTHNDGADWSLIGAGLRAAYLPPEQQYNQNIQDPHRLVQCPAQPNHFWIQHHNGIFRSTDHALQWQEITSAQPSNFGFAVAVHPNNPELAWFVPAVKDECRIPVNGQLVVMHTSDGGQTFRSLTQGLPTEPSYDLIYRHGLAIDTSGNGLAFGSTTGGLWVTENQGAQWQCISAHLPPIYWVGFV